MWDSGWPARGVEPEGDRRAIAELKPPPPAAGDAIGRPRGGDAPPLGCREGGVELLGLVPRTADVLEPWRTRCQP